MMKLKFFYIFLIIQLTLLFISSSFFAFQPYFWSDHKYLEYVHNISLNKGIFEVLINSANFNGITLQIINPNLNLLSSLNYNIGSVYDYYFYLILLRIFEICTVILHIKYFIKKISISDLVLILLLYLIYLVNSSGFDHQSYINFPIIIFCFFHGLSLYLKNNYFFFLVLFLGNIWSFLINPIYFFVTCFYPLIFYYSYLIFKKKYLKLILTFLANLPFAISFVLISLGTARIALSDLIPGSENHYNFVIYKSISFLFLSFIFFMVAIKSIYEKRNYFFSFFFLLITITSVFFGQVYKVNPDKWIIPQPEYLDYSFQHIFLVIVFLLLKFLKNDNFKKILLLLLLLLFIYRSLFFLTQFNKNSDILQFVNVNNTIIKKFFWNKDNDENFIFKNDLKNKKVLVNIPNFNSDFWNSTWKNSNDLNKKTQYDYLKYYYNSSVGGSLNYITFWRNAITTNEGHSQYLGIAAVVANLEKLELQKHYNSKFNKDDLLYLSGSKIFERQTIPAISYSSPLLSLYDIDFILSDVPLNLILYKKYSFENYNFFLYRPLDIKKNNLINKIIYIDSFEDYNKNLYNFNKHLYINKKVSFKNNTKKFCSIKNVTSGKSELVFDVFVNHLDSCIAVFPVAFSYGNNFYFNNKNFNDQNNLLKCDTFRVQYYFHGCEIKKSTRIIVKKVNLISYTIASLKDFLEFKNIKKSNL